ncbi:glutamine amidotransferase [Longimycelium tulufanense]|uniref:Glutamine amidotransferase n=1 Tax=Longimycelium tulufanense TaxID=907463 RepID=A0A8J3CFU5_9PSEU|nr:glutamine amidotransferase [Longimycelium tulufanense]
MLVLELSELDPLGPLGEWLLAADAELAVLRPARESFPDSPDGYHALVCLGGEMSSLDVATHPWLADVRALLARAVAARVPVLAICLGAQLLAQATGGQVRRGVNGPEIGPSLVAKRDATAYDPLWADVPFTPDVIQFHEDEIHRLPPGAELLAASPRYQNQAFRVGTCAYGVQFHIETTPDTVLNWMESAPALAASARPELLEPQRLAQVHADLAETWRPVIERFVQLARSHAGFSPDDPPPPRPLPLA